MPTPEENVIEADATKDTDTLKRKAEDAEEPAAPKKTKTDEIATAPASEAATPADSNQVTKLKPEKQDQNKEYFEYLADNDETIGHIFDFFGISERFPRDRFMVKNKEGLSLNKIYYTSGFAKTIINANKERGMKFIHCGVVMFVAHKIKDAQYMHAPWRLQSEGISILEPWASKRIVNCTSKATLKQLVCEMFPKLPREGEHGLGEVGDQLQPMDIGCCFVRVEKNDAEDIPFRMVLPMWRHPGSANMMVDKDDRKAMLLRLWGEKDTEIINHVADKAKREAAEEDAKASAIEGENAEAMDVDENGGVPVDAEA
jgi:multisite-specific tRNA:(cytosine-C5)-methyltransferase